MDWQGNNFCGLTYDWNYKDGYVDVSMPNYVQKPLTWLNHKPVKYPQYSPHKHIPVIYSKQGDRQYTTTPDTTQLLSPTETKYIQSIVGSFLYYGRALDCTILTVLNEIGHSQAQPTEKNKRTMSTIDGLSLYI